MDSVTEDVAQQLIDGMALQLPRQNFALEGIEVQLGAGVDLDAGELKRALMDRLPGVLVEITLVPILMRCLDCGAEYPADEHPCPVCGSPHAEILRGNELQIVRAWGKPPATTG
mgnify:CR=1 FL=1